MTLRGPDGYIRRFKVARQLRDIIGPIQAWSEAECLECGYPFGVHDTKVIMPEFKRHMCKFGRLLDKEGK